MRDFASFAFAADVGRAVGVDVVVELYAWFVAVVVEGGLDFFFAFV